MLSTSPLHAPPPRIRSLALCLGLGLALSAPLQALAQAVDLHISGGGGGGGGGGGSCGSTATSPVGTGGGGGGGGGFGTGISSDAYADYQGGGGGGGAGSSTATGNSAGGNGGAGTLPGGLNGGQGSIPSRLNGQDGGASGNEGGKGGLSGSVGGTGGAGGDGGASVDGYWPYGVGGNGGNGALASAPGPGTSGTNGSNGSGGGGGGGGSCSTGAVNPAIQVGGTGGTSASRSVFLLDSLYGALIISGGGGGRGGTAGSTNGGGGGGGGSVAVDGSIGLEAATLTVAGGDGGVGNLAPVGKEFHAAPGDGGPGGNSNCTGNSGAPGCYGYGGGGGNATLTASYPGSGSATIVVTDSLTVQSGAWTRTSASVGGGLGGAATFNTDSLDAPPLTNVIKQSGAVSFNADLMNVRTPRSVMNLTGTAASDVNIGQMDFYLPDTLTSGATMLTVTGALDIGATQIEVGVTGTGSPLKIGDRIVLISGSGVVNGPNNTTSAGSGMTTLPSHYKFDLSRQGNQIVATVTQVPPVLTDKIINPAITEADFSVVSSLDATGYWVVVPWTSACPDAAGIVGNPGSAHGAMTAGTPYPFTWTGLSANTYYTLCLVADGTAGSPNYSAVWQGQFKTGQASAPILTTLEVDKASITANSANFSATSDTTGTGYWLALADGEELPGGSTGNTSDFVAAATSQSNTAGMLSNRAASHQLTGLTPDTVYVLYFIATDSSGSKYSAIRTASFKTLALPAALAGAIPTLGDMALALLALLLAGGAARALRRRY